MTWPEAIFFSVLTILGLPLGLWFLTIWTLLLFSHDVPDAFLMPWRKW